MIDLETMGTTPDSAIVSFGAAEFNFKTGEIGHTIYRVIDLESTLKYGFKVGAGTVYWWLQQTEMARKALVQDDNREPIEVAMSALRNFLRGVDNPNRVRLWGNGPTFDNAMIRHTFEVVKGEAFPVPFWNDRCVRTIKGFYPDELWQEWRLNNQREGTYHNALDDAKYQVKYLCHILKELGVEEIY